MANDNNCGPVYGVELLDELPLGDGGMRQALPKRADLQQVLDVIDSQRVVAGYEVLLSHYRKLDAELEAASSKLADVWIHLDSWARGEAPCLAFIQQAAASILQDQQAPGWKEKPATEAE